jgi:V/A-type H+-transporting ATPase subunit A
VVSAFHGLSRDRANARRFPSIDPLESWSRYRGFIDSQALAKSKEVLFKGNEVNQMMKVIGEEGTSMEDFLLYLKAEFLDNVYLQQNGFDKVDAATSLKRQSYCFARVCAVLSREFHFSKKDQARKTFYELRQLFIDWNYKQFESPEFSEQEKKIESFLAGQQADQDAKSL